MTRRLPVRLAPGPLEEYAARFDDLFPVDRAGRGKKRVPVCWPEAIRSVRGWLEPYVMLWRYCRALSDLPPPTELRTLLERVFSGQGLYLYVR
jgi:hypothetical protein